MSDSASQQSTTRVVNVTRPLLRVSRPFESQYFWIHKGKQGSLQTAAEMARLVRKDTITDEGLERHVASLIINARLDSHAAPRDVIDVIFRYIQKLAYIYDPAGSFDSIQSARQTLEKGYGDCDDLSVALATMLAVVGYRPRFVLARYKEANKGYDHIYVDVELPDGRLALDPSTRSHGIGWESPKAIETVTIPIFSRASNGQSGFGFGPAVAAAAPIFAIPVWGQLALAATMLIQPIIGLFSRKQQRLEEQTRDEWKDQIYIGLTDIQRAIDSCQITAQDGTAAARILVDEYYKACDKFTKQSVSASCRNFEKEDYPGGPQEGAFVTRTKRIADAGKSCGGGAAVAGGGVSAFAATNASSGGTSSLATLLLVGAGAFVLLKLAR